MRFPPFLNSNILLLATRNCSGPDLRWGYLNPMEIRFRARIYAVST